MIKPDGDKKKSKIVLVIEDEMDMRFYLMAMVRSLGFDAILTQNGVKGLDVLLTLVPDLIILDVMMPEKNGYELCKIIKKKKILSEIPVIFLTAKIETEDLAEGFKAGGADYITKPLNNEELKIRVKNHLELSLSRKKSWR